MKNDITINIQVTITKDELDFILSNGGFDFESYNHYDCSTLETKGLLIKQPTGMFTQNEILYKVLENIPTN